MGVERWVDNEHNDTCSINEQRRRAEREILKEYENEERRYQEQLQRDDLARQGANHRLPDPVTPAVGMLNQGVNSQLRSDPIYKEAQTVKFVVTSASDIILGTALVVASCATEAIHNSALAAAEERSIRDYKSDIPNIANDYEERKTITMSEYKADIVEARKAVLETHRDEFRDYQYAKDEAEKIKSQADQDYKRESESLKRREDVADDKYKRARDDFERKTNSYESEFNHKQEESAKIRDRSISSAQDAYKREETRLKSEYSGAELKNELAKAERTRDSRIEQAEKTHQSNIDSYKENRDKAMRVETQKLSNAESAHHAEIRNINNDKSIALDKKNQVHAEQNAIIKSSKDKYQTAVDGKKSEYDNAKLQLSKFQANSMNANSTDVGQKLSGKYNLNANSSHISGKTAGRYAEVLMKNHTALGLDIAARNGTADEKAIIARIQNGTASQRDKEKQRDIVQKYAGNIGSARGVDDSIQKLNRTANKLSAEIKTNNKLIKEKTNVVNDLDKKINATKLAINQYRNDRDALKSGKNSKGIALTAEEKKAIKARMDKFGNIDDAKKTLSSLTKNRNRENNILQKAKKSNQDASRMKGNVERQIKNLKRGGKQIADTITKKKVSVAEATKAALNPAFAISLMQKNLNTGGSKKANRMADKGAKKIINSVNRIQDKAARKMHEGNVLHSELLSTSKTMRKIAKPIDTAAFVAKKSVAMIGVAAATVLKHNGRIIARIGGNTRLGQKLAGLLNSRAGRFMKGAATAVGVGSLSVIGGVLGAPGTLLRAPSMILNAPKKLGNFVLKGAARTTRRAVGFVGGGALRLTRKTGAVVGRSVAAVGKSAFKHTIGRTKWWQRSGSKFTAGISRVGFRIVRFGKKLLDYNPVRLVQRAAGAIIGAIFGLISTIVSAIISLLSWLIGFILLIAILIAIITIIFGLLYSILDTVRNWLKSTTSEYRSLVKNQPNYIMNQAVNYRNAELDIFELFRAAQSNPSLIKVNDSPIYYALNANNFIDANKQRTNKLTKNNTSTYNKLENLLKDAGATFNKTTLKNKFDSRITSYSNVALKYYTADQLKTVSSGEYAIDNSSRFEQYILKPGATASEFEISNARDALAMVDSLYMGKTDTMQKIEVLAYLGVGDYQVGVNNGNSKTYSADNKAADSLFWLSHNFIYNSGNENNDIYFHRTVKGTDTTFVRGDDLIRVHNYVVDNRDTSNSLIGSCDNHVGLPTTADNYVSGYEVYTKEYNKTEYTHAHETLGEYDNYDDRGWSGYGEYKVTDATLPNKMVQSLTPTQLYYYQMFESRGVKDGGLSTDGDFEYRVVPGTGKKVWTAAINKIDSEKLTKLHKNSNCNKLNFYRKDTNTYYVSDIKGNYMGTYKVGSDSKFYNAITEIKTTSGKKQVNKINGSTTISLQYFFVKWDSEKDCYVFRIMCKGKPKQMSEPGGFEELLATAKTQIGVVYSQGKWSTTTNPKNGRSRSHPCVKECIYYNTGTKHWTCKQSNGRNYYSEGNSYGTHGLDCSSYCSYIFAYTFPDKYKYMWTGGPFTTFSFDTDATSKGYKLPIGSNPPKKGDILWRDGHVAFYIGDNRYLHASDYGVAIGYGTYNPSTHSRFTHVLRYPIDGGSAEFKPNSSYTWSESLKDTYSSINTYHPKFDSTKVKITCSDEHKFNKKVTHQIVYDYCKGHVDLDVAMVVALATDKLFDDARKVTGMLEEKEAGAFLGILHDPKQDLWGLGDVTYKVFDPNKDWAVNSKNRKLAEAKMETNIEYYFDESDEKAKKLEDLVINIKHYGESSTFPSLVLTDDNQLLFNMRFANHEFPVPHLVSGQQVNVIMYEGADKNKKKYLQFNLNGGVPSYRATTAPDRRYEYE